MSKLLKLLTFAPFISIFTLNILHAARPLNTDDAAITPKNHCQIETWQYINTNEINNNSSYWVMPACNLVLDTEITLGWSAGAVNDAIAFQAKRLVYGSEEEPFAVAMTIGNIFNYNKLNNNLNTLFINIPITYKFFDDLWRVHLNLGYNLSYFKDFIYSYGLATEVAILKDRMYFIAEMYNTRFDLHYYQIGFRTWIILDTLQIDTTYGNAFSGENDYISVGLRMIM